MPCVSLLWRRITRWNYLFGLFFIIVLNSIFFHHGYLQDKCAHKIQEKSHNDANVDNSRRKARVKKLVFLNDTIGEFKWRKEIAGLLDVIPVLEWNPNSIFRNRSETPLFKKMEVFLPLDDYLSIGDVENTLVQTYNRIIPGKTTFDLTKAYRDRLILNCENIEYLERQQENPMLTYGFQGGSKKRGELRLHDGQTINIVMNIFKRTDHSDTGERDESYEAAKTDFFKLLKMQRWPGIPRIYGACISTDDKKDITTIKSSSKQERWIRYIVDRNDDAFPMCFSRDLNDDCAQLTKLQNFVKGSPQPSLTALKIMRGVAAAFEHFSTKGVFPYNISLNDIVITKSNEVVFKNMKPFIFLEEKPMQYDHHKRLLSNFMCRHHEDCPTPGRQENQLFFRLGQPCNEINGHCGDDKRCWGIDSSTYLCIFSSWMFRQLYQLIPRSWRYYTYIINLLECTDQPRPEHRCDWTTFLRGMNNLIKYGIAEWGEKNSA